MKINGGRHNASLQRQRDTVAHVLNVLKVVVHHPVLNIKPPSSSIKETRRRCASPSPQSHGIKKKLLKKRGKIDCKTLDFFFVLAPVSSLFFCGLYRTSHFCFYPLGPCVNVSYPLGRDFIDIGREPRSSSSNVGGRLLLSSTQSNEKD
jgi:hypothetical protein